MKSRYKVILAGSAAAVITVLPFTSQIYKAIASASPISKTVTGAPDSGKFGFISPESLLSSGGYLYIPEDAKVQPKGDDTHTLQVVNSGGKVTIVTNCSFVVQGHNEPIPTTARKVAELRCSP